jgi:hypothetical protein
MTRIIKNFFIAAIFAAFLLGAANIATAQTSPKAIEPSFDVVLQTVVASNETGSKSGVPQSLANVVKKLKTDFPFSAYYLSATYMQRVSNRGNFDSRSVSYASEPNKNLAVFSEWSIGGVESVTDEYRQESIQIQNFRFGQRLPIATSNNAVAYEPVGLNTRFSLAKNTPTIIGSVTTSNPDELMFVILTVKSAEK